MTKRLDLPAIRAQFATLRVPSPAVHADTPGGAQVPDCVITAMGEYLRTSVANTHGAFATSRATDALVGRARERMRQFYNAASAEEIVFGPNMTSLTFALSRALAATWTAGDAVVVTRLDHDANVAPWRRAAAERGATVRELGFTEAGGLDAAELQRLLCPRTRLVALTLASNALGTVVDIRPLIDAAHASGALVYLDAVHYAPHLLPDVQSWDCDFATCSAYKFCGPHLGMLYGKRALLAELPAYKVRPAQEQGPERWETGTANFEGIAGLAAQLDYLAGLGGGTVCDRPALVASYAALAAHEQELSRAFLAGCAELPAITVHGISDLDRLQGRTPTFGLTLAGRRPDELAARLAERDIYAWSGHFYAIGITADLGLDADGGLLRLGFGHYHTLDDVERVLVALRELAR